MVLRESFSVKRQIPLALEIIAYRASLDIMRQGRLTKESRAIMRQIKVKKPWTRKTFRSNDKNQLLEVCHQSLRTYKNFRFYSYF
jgi:hypothetical protein